MLTSDRTSDRISIGRSRVHASYEAAKWDNTDLYAKGNVTATEEYIYPNQVDDAERIVDLFYQKDLRVISVQKRTKVGADGLMLEIAKNMTTHVDDAFVVNVDNVRIITGMSNKKWESEMINKAPSCFKDKIFHHGKLKRIDFDQFKNGLIIVDEIDSGSKEEQNLHKILRKARLWDVKNMIENTNRFVFVSATMLKEQHALTKWGKLHQSYRMTIPSSYIGHDEFLKRDIVKEFYPLDSYEIATKWVQTDILENYKDDYRISIVRMNENTKIYVKRACDENGILFREDTTDCRLSEEEESIMFTDPLKQHYVIGIKGFYRRATLIPNKWKLRIGATHEKYVETIDNNVQIQGLPGRMTGYWRDEIAQGHKTGPHRTSIKAIEEYNKSFDDPFGKISYQSSGHKVKDGKITAKPTTMLAAKNIDNLLVVSEEQLLEKASCPVLLVDLDDVGCANFQERNKDAMLQLLQTSDEAAYQLYKSFKVCCWNMDTEDKKQKWGYTTLRQPGAMSSSTNIDVKTDNVLMMYLYQNTLILAPWRGENLCPE